MGQPKPSPGSSATHTPTSAAPTNVLMSILQSLVLGTAGFCPSRAPSVQEARDQRWRGIHVGHGCLGLGRVRKACLRCCCTPWRVACPVDISWGQRWGLRTLPTPETIECPVSHLPGTPYSGCGTLGQSPAVSELTFPSAQWMGGRGKIQG